jgi:hypothetical protein
MSSIFCCTAGEGCKKLGFKGVSGLFLKLRDAMKYEIQRCVAAQAQQPV